MSILVTGAGGFLGRSIVASLLRAGRRDLRCQVRLAGRSPALAAALESAGIARTAAMAEGNLLSKQDCARLVAGATTIVHAAAGTRGAAADMMLNSVVATRNLLEAARAAAVRRIVLVSSFAVYDAAALARGAVLDEQSPLERDGVAKGAYAMSKLWQERMLAQLRASHDVEVVVLRPGVIYGPGGPAMSSRVGIRAMGLFFNLGGRCLLPLTHVDNCADAVVLATLTAPPGATYNVVDDDLPTCSEYLRRYRALVEPLRVVRFPYPALALAVRGLVAYSRRSHGQLPAVLNPHIVRSMYRPLGYSNAALKALGWAPAISIDAGLTQTMAQLRAAREAG